MKKLLVILFFIFTAQITACEKSEQSNKEKFFALADAYISDVKFETEITDEYVQFSSENLSEPIIYKNGQLVCGELCWDINKNNQSPIHIKDLIRYILDTRTLSGNYNNIDYTCELDTLNNVPYKIIWGNITVEFAYFE